nr:ribonuclease H-like domain-containing protein [Tanacetum cinerariifolium]
MVNDAYLSSLISFLEESFNVISIIIRQSPISNDPTTSSPSSSPPSSPTTSYPTTSSSTSSPTTSSPTTTSPTNITLPPKPQPNPNSVPVHLMSYVFVSGLIILLSSVFTGQKYVYLDTYQSSISPLPKSYTDVFNDPNWQNAMCDEYNALIKIDTWTLVPRPIDANIVCYMWLFRPKYLAYGTLSRYKARLVANSSMQLEGIDVDLIFSLVVKLGAIQTAHMVNCDCCRTPVDTESKLGDDGDLVSDPTLYRSLVGSLRYLMFTRPDISYAVQHVCLYMHDPLEPYFSALKWILRYVHGTLDHGLQLLSSSTTSLVCPTTRRSTSGYYVFLGNNLLSWSFKRQPTLSRSSAEARYCGVSNGVAKTCWLRNLLRELHTPLSSATLIYCDNVSAVYLSSNPIQHQRTKHIEVDIYLVRDLVAAGQVRVLHVLLRYQYVDIFTKGLSSALFEEFRTSLSVRCPPSPTEEEC